MIVWLATGRRRKTLGTDLVGSSRAIYSEMMTIGNPLHKIDRIDILKIVQGKVCDIRRVFEIRLNLTAQGHKYII